MSIKAAVYHLTHYKYDRPVFLQPQIIRLQPAPHSQTKVLSHSLRVSPAEHFVTIQQDPYGNYLARFALPAPVPQLKTEADLLADMPLYTPCNFLVGESAEIGASESPKQLRMDRSVSRQGANPGQE